MTAIQILKVPPEHFNYVLKWLDFHVFNFVLNVSGASSPFSMLTINTGNNMFSMPSPTSLSPGISPSLMSSPSMSPLVSLGLPWGNMGLLQSAHERSSQNMSQHSFAHLLNTSMSQGQQYHQHTQHNQHQQLLLQQLLPR